MMTISAILEIMALDGILCNYYQIWGYNMA